jgi:hypothetical protein
MALSSLLDLIVWPQATSMEPQKTTRIEAGRQWVKGHYGISLHSPASCSRKTQMERNLASLIRRERRG